MPVLNLVIVGFGGFIGTVFRYMASWLPVTNHTSFPVATLLVNIVGSLVIGALVGFAGRFDVNPSLMLFLRVGFCGGFTTYSAFALEIHQLFGSGKTLMAAGYIGASLVFGIAAVIAGEQLAIRM
jgi:CrcB protein